MWGLETLSKLNDNAAKLSKVGKERTVYSPSVEDLNAGAKKQNEEINNGAGKIVGNFLKGTI